MPQQVKVVSDMEIDEISLVDRPANQHAAVVLAKRATQEDSVADEYFNADGTPIDIDNLTVGDVIYDVEGDAYEIELDDELEDERELATVGKSAFFEAPAYDPVSKSLTDTLREELAKALDSEGDAKAEVLSKALEEISKFEARAVQAESIAKAERDLRLTREYISKAAEYNVPVAPEELGPVLMRMAESMSYDDCSVIHKALTTSGALLAEVGMTGEATNDDPFEAIQDQLDAQVAKSAGEPVSKAQALTAFFDNDPAAYERYRAERGR